MNATRNGDEEEDAASDHHSGKRQNVYIYMLHDRWSRRRRASRRRRRRDREAEQSEMAERKTLNCIDGYYIVYIYIYIHNECGGWTIEYGVLVDRNSES